jgi:predicted DNA-binding protein with PD1-like motif
MDIAYNAAVATGERIIVARIMPKRDLIESIERICVDYDISYGIIVSSIGSLCKVSLNIVTRTIPEPGKGHADHIELEGPFSLLCGQGIIMPGDDPNRREIHYHVAIRGENLDINGGHVGYGTQTLSTTDISIHEISGIRAVREIDKKLGVKITAYKQE